MIRVIEKGNPNTERYWDKRYNEIEPEGKDAQKNEIIANHIVDGTKVIELGCGPGWLVSRIKSQKSGCHVVGVDYSRRAIAEVKKDSRIKAIRADSTKVNIEGADSFDYVICCEVLEHLNEPEELVKEMARLSKPGGLSILTTPFGDHIPSSEHVWEFGTESVAKMFEEYFGQSWVYPWASGGGVSVVETGEVVYPGGHLDVIWALGIK